MDQKTERIVAYCIAIILFVVGVVCYSAFAKKAPEEPIRIMLKSTAGNILFDHKEHASESGYSLDCNDCHHDFEEGDNGGKPDACGECHGAEEEDAPKRSDAFHIQCKGCHEDEGTAPVNCKECHIL